MSVDPVFDDGPITYQSNAPTPGNPAANSDSGPSATQRNNGTSSGYNRNEFGNGVAANPIEGDADSIEPASYPLMSFTGRGNLDHRNGSAEVVQKISAVMTKETLTVTVQQFSAEGGDNQSDVNDEIEQQTGDTIYRRIGKSDASARLTAIPGDLFLIHSKSFEDRRAGKLVTFAVTSGDPLPVLVVPAVESRYAELAKGPIRTTSVINTAGKSFTVHSTVTGQKMAQDSYRLTIEYTIPEDKAGELYGMLPMARSADYGIDTLNKRISSISTRSVYNDEDNRRARAINIGFNLCKSIQDGRIQNFASCD